MRRGSALPLIVVALFFVGGLVYLGMTFVKSNVSTRVQSIPTPPGSPDPYPDWKTYTNKTYGFTLRYPKIYSLKEYDDHSADFYVVDPKNSEVKPGAAEVRYLMADTPADKAEFAKIQSTEEGSQFAEVLDVRSQVTKVKNFNVGKFPAIEYVIDRAFSALEGPKGEFSHLTVIEKDGAYLKFISHAETKEDQVRFNDPTFSEIISSIKFTN